MFFSNKSIKSTHLFEVTGVFMIIYKSHGIKMKIYSEVGLNFEPLFLDFGNLLGINQLMMGRSYM